MPLCVMSKKERERERERREEMLVNKSKLVHVLVKGKKKKKKKEGMHVRGQKEVRAERAEDEYGRSKSLLLLL